VSVSIAFRVFLRVSCLSIFRGRSAEVYGRRGGWMFFA